MKLSPGKLAGMKAVSDRRGMIAAAAIDQRRSLAKTSFEPPKSRQEELERAVQETHVSAVPNSRSGSPERTTRSEQPTSDRLFALIFLSVMIMISILLVGSSMMSWYSHDKDLLSRQTDALLAMAKYGFAAIIGLLLGWKLRR